MVFFDGVCNLCNRAVRFVIQHDRKATVKFCSLQSDYAVKIFAHANGMVIKSDSVVFLKGDNFFVKSEAVLELFLQLGTPWRFLYVFKAIPRSWRDRLYDVIAKNRYRWFGKQDSCMVPSKDIENRFLP